MRESEAEIDLIRFLRGGPISAIVLTDDELICAYQLIERGVVRRFWRSGAHQLLGIWHMELVNA